MSLYRQAGRRPWSAIVVAVIAGIVVGGIGGYLAGKASESEPTLAEQVADLQTEAEPIRLATQQVKIEYRGTVENGKVVSPTEYQAARSTVERALATFSALEPDLSAIDSAGAERLGRELEALSELVASRASEREVQQQAAATSRAPSATVIAPTGDE